MTDIPILFEDDGIYKITMIGGVDGAKENVTKIGKKLKDVDSYSRMLEQGGVIAQKAAPLENISVEVPRDLKLEATDKIKNLLNRLRSEGNIGGPYSYLLAVENFKYLQVLIERMADSDHGKAINLYRSLHRLKEGDLDERIKDVKKALDEAAKDEAKAQEKKQLLINLKALLKMEPEGFKWNYYNFITGYYITTIPGREGSVVLVDGNM